MLVSQQGERRTVLGQQIVGSANDEFGDEISQFLQFLLAFCLDFIAGIGITTTNNEVLEILAEIILRTKEIWIRKVQQRKVFGEIIL